MKARAFGKFCAAAGLDAIRLQPEGASLEAVTRRHLLALVASEALAAVSEIALENLKKLDEIAIQAELDHVQGIDVRGEDLWISSVNREARRGWLHRVALPSGEAVRAVEVQQRERFHPGGVALDEDSIWVPVAEYKPLSSAVIQRRRADTLELEASFPVGDHIGCVAADGDRLVGGNWDSELFYEWDRQGRETSRKSRRTETHYQDLKLSGGLLVASGNLGPGRGSIDWLSPLTYTLRRRLIAGETDRGVRFTNEGMAVADGKLYLLPEDGPSRLFVFRLPG